MTSLSPEIDAHRLRELLKSLIDIYSPSGKEEEISGFLCEYLEAHGLVVRRQQVDGRRHNLVVAPSQTQPVLALVAHLDTVPAHDLDAYASRDDGERIHGLGAADMKGGCAAMVEAVVSFMRGRDEVLPAALCLVVGEEEEGDGAERLVQEVRAPWAIVGEPTELAPCLAHDGYLELELSTRGRRAHASLARRDSSAVGLMLEIVQNLSAHIDAKRPELVYNIRDLASAGSGFVVPERCDASIDVHVPPGARIAEVIAELEATVDSLRLRHTEVDAEMRVRTIDAGFELPENGPVVAALEESFERRSLSWEPRVFRSHSDANRLWSAGVRPVMLGPGSLRRAHAPDEWVSFDEVAMAARIYLDVLFELADAFGSDSAMALDRSRAGS